jgi:quinol monooxygenase YgiN/predicted small metal-binding protein
VVRKYVDCRDQPSVMGCTLAMSGEEEELLTAAAAHAVSVHGHTDNDELRAAIRADMHDSAGADTEAGAFVQLIEFHTDRIDEVDALTAEWADTIGSERTARWAVSTADHDHAHTYVQIVEFPDEAAAQANSRHPVTARFAERLRKLCEGPVRFTNLDVRASTAL